MSRSGSQQPDQRGRRTVNMLLSHSAMSCLAEGLRTYTEDNPRYRLGFWGSVLQSRVLVNPSIHPSIFPFVMYYVINSEDSRIAPVDLEWKIPTSKPENIMYRYTLR